MAASPLRASTSVIGKLFGNAVSSAVGFGAGVAMSPVLGPVVRDIANKVNSQYSFVFPEPGTLATGVSQGQVDRTTAGRWASYWGLGDDAFNALVSIANTGPGVPAAFDLWRRGVIDDGGFRRAAKRGGLEQEWIDALFKTKRAMLDPADIARGIHRGLIPDPGLLKGAANPGPGKVEAYPQYPIDALAEAAAHGFEKDDLGVLVGLQGNPMGPHEAAQAEFRGTIEHNDYLRAIAEGNTRNEWAEPIFEQSRQIPTSTQFMENALRGHHELAWALDQAARHGMTKEDAFVLWQNAGRPLNLHQITQGLAWGAKYQPAAGDNPDPWMQAVLLGPVRPEYYELQHSLKYTLPSALYFRTLQQSGVLKAADAETWYLRLGWPPELANQVAEAYAKPRGAAAKEASASDILALYDGEKATRAETLAALEALGYPADEAAAKVDVLDARRVSSAKGTAISDLHAAFRKTELTVAQATAAVAKLVNDPATAPQIVTAWQVYRDAFPPEAPPVTPPPVA